MDSNSGRKRWYEEVEEGEGMNDKVYKFRVLLPDGLSVGVILNQVNDQMSLQKFLELVKREYVRNMKEDKATNAETKKKKFNRKIDWMHQELCVQDVVDEYKWGNEVCFERYKHNRWNLLRLDDGRQNPAKTFEGMWDVTPNIPKLPDSYSFLTALSDITDNSLQSVWLNNDNERRMISVNVKDDKILIADTGPGMDGGGENSIAKWGKMGLALRRFSGTQDTRRKRPYLEPSFGMFGYGGLAALMRLGRHATISSKMKNSNKVYILDMKREALLHSSGEMSWKISGGVRDPLEDELTSPHNSFTKVEIYQLEEPAISAFKLQCCLKDIYYPYIQNDEVTTAKTSGPVEFKVNGEDLAQIHGGEVAITNMHSCNGPEFVVQLHLSYESKETSGSRLLEANARLKYVYFPIRDGGEGLNKILEKLEADGCGVSGNFDTFCRISIRQLGRLLPDASWPGLPFKDLNPKKGDKTQIREALTGTTTVGLPYRGGVVVAADCRGTSKTEIRSNVINKLRMLGSTRAITLAGRSSIAEHITKVLSDQLDAAEKANGDLQTVAQSSECISRNYKPKKETEVEFLLVGWDNKKMDGPPVLRYANQRFQYKVKKYKTTGCGRALAEEVLIKKRYKSTMKEEEAERIAELSILAGALGSWRTGGAMDLWIFRDGGEIIKRERKLMTDLAIKHNYLVDDLQQAPQLPPQ